MSSSLEDEVIEDVTVVEEEDTESSDKSKNLSDNQRKRATRLLQRSRTKELATLDLIDNSNRSLRRLLRITNSSPDVFSAIMDIVSAKDKELIRLRRELLRSRTSLEATRHNIIPRLKSKAAQAKVLQTAVNDFKNQRPRGKMPRALVRESV